MGLAEPVNLRDKLLAYLNLLQRWGKAYNLTSIRKPEDMVVRHLLDSLAIAPLLGQRPGACIDVGTGAGLPGIPLALVFPERQFSLLDSNGKKTRFLFQVKTELGLANMVVRGSRVEAYQPEQKYAVVLSRAFSSLSQIVVSCNHLLTENGRFLAMKGMYPEQELAELPAAVELVSVHKLTVPQLDEERHLIELRRVWGEQVWPE